MHHQIMPVGAEHSRRQFSHHPLQLTRRNQWHLWLRRESHAKETVQSKQDGAWGLSPQLTPHTTHIYVLSSVEPLSESPSSSLRQVTRTECRLPILTVLCSDTSSYGELIFTLLFIHCWSSEWKKRESLKEKCIKVWQSQNFSNCRLKFRASRLVPYTWEHRLFRLKYGSAKLGTAEKHCGLCMSHRHHQS